MIDERKRKIIKEFGKTLKKIRKAKGLSLRELAAASGIDHSQIALYEAGQSNLEMTTVVDLADGLEVDPGELFAFPR
jgi:transcriptional regulator with XRE-family HTH domain